MNYIDFIVLIILIISVIGGISKGFVYELASLIGLIAGVWGAIKFSGVTQRFLERQFNIDSNWVHIIAFIITFVGISILVHFLAKALEEALENVSLGVVNKIFGGVFAFFKTAFFIGVIFLIFNRVGEVVPKPVSAMQNSKFYQPMSKVAVYTFPFLTDLYSEISRSKKRESK
jgi:membrane protein required for colicin V production